MLKIAGRSGCKLEPIYLADKLYIRKTSSHELYNGRLKNQKIKQEKLAKLNRFNNFFIVPFIINEGFNGSSLYYFEMEYINAYKFSDFFSRISFDDLKKFLEKIIKYFEDSFSESEYKTIDKKIIENKIFELEEKISLNENINKLLFKKNIFFLKNNIPNSRLPFLECHGDLTLSNLLFGNNGNIYVFDFLDSFIESPLVDLVKIRQDTRLKWSLLIDKDLESQKKLRVIQILNYLDVSLDLYLKKSNPDLLEWFSYLEVFNLIRILPYVTEEIEIKFIEEKLSEINETI
jgi:hypothetical protein